MRRKQTQQLEGINAIIYLQSLAGITEPTEKAKRGWLNMTPHDRQRTLAAYRLFKKVGGE